MSGNPTQLKIVGEGNQGNLKAWIIFPKERELQNGWVRLFCEVLPFTHPSWRVENTTIFKYQKYPIYHARR